MPAHTHHANHTRPALVEPCRVTSQTSHTPTSPLPATPPQREQILGKLLAGEALAADVSLGALARDCDGFSGSDLKNLCLKAAYAPVRCQSSYYGRRWHAPHRSLTPLRSARPASGARPARARGGVGRRRRARDAARRRRAARGRDARLRRRARKMRVSVAKSSASRDAMKAWHEKFGEGSTPSGGDGIGF